MDLSKRPKRCAENYLSNSKFFSRSQKQINVFVYKRGVTSKESALLEQHMAVQTININNEERGSRIDPRGNTQKLMVISNTLKRGSCAMLLLSLQYCLATDLLIPLKLNFCDFGKYIIRKIVAKIGISEFYKNNSKSDCIISIV